MIVFSDLVVVFVLFPLFLFLFFLRFVADSILFSRVRDDMFVSLVCFLFVLVAAVVMHLSFYSEQVHCPHRVCSGLCVNIHFFGVQI